MKKKLMLSLLLTLCLCLMLSACGEKPAPTPDPNPDPVTDPVDPTEPADGVDPQVRKYFEYFQHNSSDFLALAVGGTEEDKAAHHSAYLLLKLASEEDAAGKEIAFSYPKAEFDRVSMEYLGEAQPQYDTRMTALTPEGNVVSTGWGPPMPNFMVLDKLVEEGTNQYRGSFSCYFNPYGMGENPEEPYEDCCTRMMKHESLPTDTLLGTYVLEWTEWESPLLGLQLRYAGVEYAVPADCPPRTNKCARRPAGVFLLILSHRSASGAAFFANHRGKAPPESRFSPH